MESRPLQIIPAGLLGFLQLKNAGQNPTVVPESLQATMDLLTWYLSTEAQDLARATASIATGTVGFASFTTPPIVVPNGEWWYVHNFTIRTTALAATDQVHMAPGMVPQPASATGVTLAMGEGQLVVVPAATVGAATCSNRAPFFAPPGAELVIDLRVCLLTAGPETFTGMVRYTALPI